jgi:hypothetical protein
MNNVSWFNKLATKPHGLGDWLGNKSIKPLGSKNCDWLDFVYSKLDCYYNLFEVGLNIC